MQATDSIPTRLRRTIRSTTPIRAAWDAKRMVSGVMGRFASGLSASVVAMAAAVVVVVVAVVAAAEVVAAEAAVVVVAAVAVAVRRAHRFRNRSLFSQAPTI